MRVMEDDLDADENGDAGTESGMTVCEVVRTKWLQSGGAFPRLCLYEKLFLTHASRIAAKASRVMPNLGRSFLIMG